ncbi:MAG: PhnD/SsuA/transferrin family substrate-binding protein [Methyloprofundus sp.]|nr:PhnD/SsuA/transferrin family substrate-binding protein [Methyloprofundus sp.]
MLSKLNLSWKITLLSLAWIALVSYAHYQLNFDHGHKKVITMGYMPVITNLAAPLLDEASKDNTELYFKALKFSAFAEMAESLRNGKIDAAFIIAPLSIVLRQQGEDIKVVYIGNRHESTLVAQAGLKAESLQDLAGKTIAVPMRFSGHNISIRELLKEQGLENQIKVVEMNPPDMASALAGGSLDAYYVGEPFAAQTLRTGVSKRLFYVEEVQEKFICNLMIVRNDFIQNDPETVKIMVNAAARSGIWAKNNIDKAAQITAKYWNQPLELVKYALTEPKDRILYNFYTPQQSEMQAMADSMVDLGMLKNSDITGLVDDRFAKSVNLDNVTEDIHSIF